jgi:para-nitrobenzyl esterase
MLRTVKRYVPLIATLALLASPVLPRKGVMRAEGSPCLVTTTYGGVQGVDAGASCVFLGIPYAAPPTAALRWKPPQPPAPWGTTLNFSTPPPSCPNLNQPTPGGNEDCLKLNVWVRNPLPAIPAPVIVWLHTGSFVAASANFASHNGRRLAEETGVIVVAPNYRLGPLGFLVHRALAAEDSSHPVSGNYGLLDQRAALAWVRDNIASFGGDPNNVTLAGTSAGADSVGLHLVAPASGTLFHRAIIESGTPTIRWPDHAESLAHGDAFAAALGCVDPLQVAACMRSKPRDQVLLALPLASQQVVEPAGRVTWQPVVDGLEIPDQPRVLFETGRFNRMPTLIGFNRDEAAGSFVTRSFPAGLSLSQYEAWVSSEFGTAASAILQAYAASGYPLPRDAMARLVSDGQFVCEGQRFTSAVASYHEAVFLYSYDYEIDDVFPDRVIHGVESNILFGNDYVPAQFPNHVLTSTDLALHAAMAGYWTRFAATGNPNVDDESVVHWAAFKEPLGDGRGASRYLALDTIIRTDKRLREAQCAVWEPFYFRTMLGIVPAGG